MGFDPKSAFKTVLISMVISYAIFLLAAVAGGVLEQGLGYTLGTMLPLIMAPVLYGLIVMLFVASYNWLAPKLGGLLVEIKDENE